MTTRFAGPIVAVALAVVTVGPVADAQRFTSRADAVRVDVLVMDGGKTVRGLTARDFELRDEGVVQRVDQIEVEQLPLNLIGVFDTSGSVAGARLQNLLEAGRALFDGLRAPDRVALLSFASRVRLLSPLTTDRGRIRSALGEMTANGTTALRDAAFAGLALRETDPGRTLLLLFSDGADTSSWLTPARVLEAARRTDVVVYPVGIREEAIVTSRGTTHERGADGSVVTTYRPSLPGRLGRSVGFDEYGKFLEAIAAETGGRVVVAGSNSDLRATFVRTLAEFRDRYVLTYAAAGVPGSGWHRLAVQLKGKRGKVTARRGYFTE